MKPLPSKPIFLPKRHRSYIFIAVLVASLMLAQVVLAATLVTPSNPDGWAAANVRTDATVGITTAQPRSGDGSLEFTTNTITSGQDKADFEKIWGVVPGRTLGNLSALSYEFYRDSSSTTAAHFAPVLRLYYATPGGDTGLLIWEPIYNGYGSISTNTWISADIFSGNFWMRAFGPGRTIDDYNISLAEWMANADEEGSPIDDDSDGDVPHVLGPDTYIIGVNVGVGSGWGSTFKGYVDNVVVQFGGDEVSANFEPDPQCSTDCYVDVNNGNDANDGLSWATAKKTIQAGINQVDPNGTVHIADGAYPESLDVNKAGITLDGESQTGVIINASSFNDYSIDVTVDDITLQDFTLVGNPTGSAAYGIKVAGPSPTRLANFTVKNVTVDNSRRTGIDLNGVDGALIQNVEVKNVPSGNGLAITDSNDVTFEDITTSNNAWGGLAIYTYGRYFSLGSDNVTIQGTNSFGEAIKVYVERGNYNNPAAPEPVTNLTVNGFDYTVMNDTFRPGGPNFTFYQITRSEAIDFAIALTTPHDSYVNEIANGHFWVGQNVTDTMTIQAAVDHASSGDVVNVLEGTYPGNTVVDVYVEIIGQGSGSDPASNTILKKASNTPVVRLEASGNSSANPLLFKDLRVEPVGVHGFEVHNGQNIEYVKFDNVHVVGSNPDADFEAEVGLRVATTGSLSHVEIEDSAFDNLVYGWYFAKHSDWGPGGSNVSDVSVTNTSFSNNQAKGIYVEKLSDTTFDNVTVNNNGLDTTFFNAKWNAGFDINLKGEETYQNITIKNSTFTGNGLGAQEGAAMMIKGRDDGATYGAHPATLDSVLIEKNEISGNERGIRFGEPGQNNATPTNVVVRHNNLTNNVQTYAGVNGSAYGGVINQTQAETDAILNWWGAASGPAGVGPGTGDAVTANVLFCPWLDAAYPGGAPATGGGVVTNVDTGEIFCSIKAAVADSDTLDGHTLQASAHTFVEDGQIVIDKDITLVGDGQNSTIVKTNQNTGTGGDARGWFLVETGKVFNVSDLTFDGDGYKIWQAIRNKGEGTVDHVTFTNIKYQISGQPYAGTAVAAFGTGPVHITNSEFSEIGRIGGHYFGGAVNGSQFTGNTYTGKGTGDWLDYALDIGAGAQVTVKDNVISGNRGVASSDGSTSAAILVTTFFGAGSAATIENNHLTDNTTGIAVGYDSSDASTVIARYNNITGNDNGVTSTAPTVDAILNWWGDASGPSGAGPGTGDSVDPEVIFCPWLDGPFDGGGMPNNPDGFVHNLDSNEYFCTIQAAIDDTDTLNGHTLELSAATFTGPGNENVQVNKEVTLIGQGPASTFVDPSTVIGFLISVDNVTFQNMTIHNGDQAIRLYKPGDTIDNTTIANVHFTNNSARGIEIHNNTTVTGMLITDSKFDNSNIGIRMASSSVVDGLEVKRSEFTNNTLGIYQANDGGISTLRDLQVADSKFTNNSFAAVYAEEIRDSVVEDSEFSGNGRAFYIFKAYTGAGVDVENVTVRNNDITDSTAASIQIIQAGSGLAGPIKIEDNTINQDVGVLAANWGSIDVRLEAGYTHGPIDIASNQITFSGVFSTATSAYAVKLRGSSDDIMIKGNTLDGGHVGGNDGPPTSGIYLVTDADFYGQVSPSAVIDITENDIKNFVNGISIYDDINDVFGNLTAGSKVNINYNNLTGNSGFGVQNGAAEFVDARVNWWGDPSGPSGQGSGSGDAVSEYATFCPWLDGSVPGGQPFALPGGLVSTEGDNIPVCAGAIVVAKQSNPSPAANLDWNFEIRGDLNEDFTLDLDENDNTYPAEESFVFTEAGNFTLNEINLPGNWDLTDVDCVVEGQAGSTVGGDDTYDATIALKVGDKVTCTFVNQRRPQLQITKYEDLNTNGQSNNGEPTLSGWDISIYLEENGVWTQQQSTKTTPANGVVNFTSLEPGATYRVCEAPQAGWGTTEPSPIVVFEGLICREVPVEYGDNTAVKFGNYRLGELTIVKESNPDAPWLDWTFEGDFGAFSLDTDPNDNQYEDRITFDEVMAGEYTITETNLPSNWYVKDIVCDPDVIVSKDLINASLTINFQGSDQDVTCTFSNERLGQIKITKYEDLNRDGSRDDGEPGLENWQMFLYAEDGNGGWTQIQPREVRTDANGVANYTSLDAGTYLVCEEAPAGWANSDPGFEAGNIIDGQICQMVAVTPGQVVPVNFGNYRLGRLTVVKEATPAAEWLNWTFAGSGDIGSFTLDNDAADDTYPAQASFYLVPDTYTLDETNLPDNWDLFVSCVVAGDGGSGYDVDGEHDASITLAGGDDVTCTFANKRRPQIQITKYEDLNENGGRDDGEPGLAGWQMFLYIDDGNGGWTQIQPREVRTDANGVANYTSLEPGLNHLVCEEDREGWVNSDPGPNATLFDDKICQVVENPVYGEVREVQFGNHTPTARLTIVKDAAIEHDFVFNSDIDGHEVFTLTSATAQDRQTFSVTPGTFTISEDATSFPDPYWALLSVICEDASGEAVPDAVSDFDTINFSAKITLQQGEKLTCTFNNERSTFGDDESSNSGPHQIYIPFIVK